MLAYAGLYEMPRGRCLRTASLDKAAAIGILPLPFNDHVTGASYFIFLWQLAHLSNGHTSSVDPITLF